MQVLSLMDLLIFNGVTSARSTWVTKWCQLILESAGTKCCNYFNCYNYAS